ncbi:MAG: SDR family oxidoreductase [Candidatus Methylacidiphilales bacterium]|nr:SDR family oxidoreductase [Candidatus Methylacidiphilales bacterium]
MNTFNGHIALITGGAGGLGSALSRLLAENKFHVIIADVNKPAVDKLVTEINSKGHAASGLIIDLTNAAELQNAIASIYEDFKRLDVLINNAGIDLTVSVEEMPVEAWDRIISVNLRAPFVLSKTVFPLMRKEQQGGEIINIISTAALRAWPNASAYHASKWGFLGFSHALHTEGRPYGIRVTAVIAGGMQTPFLTDRFPDIDLTTLQDPINVAQTILHILQTPKGSVVPEIKILPMKETSWP